MGMPKMDIAFIIIFLSIECSWNMNFHYLIKLNKTLIIKSRYWLHSAYNWIIHKIWKFEWKQIHVFNVKYYLHRNGYMQWTCLFSAVFSLLCINIYKSNKSMKMLMKMSEEIKIFTWHWRKWFSFLLNSLPFTLLLD